MMIKIIGWVSLVLAVWIILYIPAVYFIAYFTQQVRGWDEYGNEDE